MYVIIKSQKGILPVSKLVVTKEEAIKQADVYLTDVLNDEGGPHTESIPSFRGEPKHGFWESGSFVVAHKHELRL